MNRPIHRLIGWTLVAAILLGPLAPVLSAQTSESYALTPGTPQYDAFVGQVRDRLAEREGLEDMYQRAAVRQQQMQADLAALQQRSVQPGGDPGAFQGQLQQLHRDIATNQGILERTQQKLTPVYKKLSDDQERIRRSGSTALSQQVGTLIGAGGAVVVPIWNRMTAADYGGMARYGAQRTHLRTVDFRIPRYQNIATNAGSRAANAEAALGNLRTVQWVPEFPAEAIGHASEGSAVAAARGGSGSNVRLVPRDVATGEVIAELKPIETSIPAKITNANGQVIDNPNGIRAGSDLAQLYNTRTQITNEISATKLKISRGINNAQKDFFDNRVAGLEQKKAALETDIAKYQAENPSIGSRFKGLAKDAGKWTLMSVGITLGANVIHQLSQNGWDPSRVQWGQTVSFLGDKSFWGGTAGSFIGSMAGSAIASAIPGGAFAKVFLSIGGAALGYQWGSGNLGRTDFLALGVTPAGSTAGYLLGMAIGGPIGAFLGGILGHFVSQFIYDKVKEMLTREVPAESGGGQAQLPPAGPPVFPGPPPGTVGGAEGAGAGQWPGPGQVPGSQPYSPPPPPPALGPFTGSPGGFSGPAPTDTGYGAQGSGVNAEVGQVADQMNQAYTLYLQAQQSGDAAAAAQRLQEFQSLRTRLQRMRQTSGGPADFRSSP
jgi:hypothetical protein